MGKSSPEKIKFAAQLLREGKSYRDVQEELNQRYGSGMSNNTLKEIHQIQFSPEVQEQKIQQLTKELALFKEMYFELQHAVKNFFMKIKRGYCPNCGNEMDRTSLMMLMRDGKIFCSSCGTLIDVEKLVN